MTPSLPAELAGLSADDLASFVITALEAVPAIKPGVEVAAPFIRLAFTHFGPKAWAGIMALLHIHPSDLPASLRAA